MDYTHHKYGVKRAPFPGQKKPFRPPSGLAKKQRDRRKNMTLLAHGARCVYCGIRLFPSTVTIDHYIPKSRGGRSHPDNYVSACLPCNRAKADMMPIEFIFKRS